MPKTINRHLQLIIAQIFIIGLLSRLYLIWILPIWYDEAFSIQASQSAWISILNGSIDLGHPPGYHLFLKLWLTISDQLQWIRLSSIIFFVINVWLLGKIGHKITKSPFKYFLQIAYIFSGYFIIFDWQVRMYVGLLTLILASIYLLIRQKYFLFTLINLLGLYFDYGFLWYFLPLILVLIILPLLYKQKIPIKPLLISWFLSFSVWAIIWLPFLFHNWRTGLNGINWIQSFLSPKFFIPYFIGSHQNWPITLLLFFSILYGGILIYQSKWTVVKLIISSSLISSLVTYIISIIYQPIFHVRSMQILGLAVIFCLAAFLNNLYQQKQYLLIGVFIFCLIINFWLAVNLIFFKPQSLLISFFGWKPIIKQLKIEKSDLLVLEPKPDLPMSLLLWGLKYTLAGKESFPRKVYNYQDINSGSVSIHNCSLIWNKMVNIYDCL